MDINELMARAAYDAIPNGGYERRDTTDTANEGTLVFVADPWEEAEDRHAECSELAESIRVSLSAAGFAIVPREPNEEMLVSGLVALVKEIEKLGMPDDKKQRLMQIGAQMRTSTEVEKCWQAMAAAAEAGK